MRRRPLHPTTPLRPEAAVAAPTEAGRRHATKPTTRKQQQKEEQEGRLQFRAKREEAIVATNSEITISEGITVKGISEKLGVKTALVIRKLVDMKIFATINQPLDLKVAEDLLARGPLGQAGDHYRRDRARDRCFRRNARAPFERLRDPIGDQALFARGGLQAMCVWWP